jgi:hypothetical protein
VVTVINPWRCYTCDGRRWCNHLRCSAARPSGRGCCPRHHRRRHTTRLVVDGEVDKISRVARMLRRLSLRPGDGEFLRCRQHDVDGSALHHPLPALALLPRLGHTSGSSTRGHNRTRARSTMRPAAFQAQIWVRNGSARTRVASWVSPLGAGFPDVSAVIVWIGQVEML